MGGGGSAGVTMYEWLGGMGSYVTNQGLSMYTDTARAGNNALSSKFKDAIEEGHPVTLFLDGFNVMDMSGLQQHNGYHTVQFTEYAGRHIMVAYGYLEINYELANGDERTDMYVYVHTGFSGTALNFIRINSHCTLDWAFITEIS